MNLHLLRVFKEVAEQGSFTLASRRLSISQPAVSKAVRDLESQLRSPLLERGAGLVRPTVVGALILSKAHTLFGAEAEMEEVLRSVRGMESGSVSIAASMTIATYYLPSILGEFHARYPQVALELISANTRNVAQILKERRVDLALVEGSVTDAEIAAVNWRIDTLVPVVGPTHRLAKRQGPVEATDLSDELFVLRELGSGTREVAMNALQQIGASVSRLMEVNSIESIVRLVSSGIGISIVSRTAIELYASRNLIVELDVHGFNATRHLARLAIKARQLSMAAQTLNGLLDLHSEIGLGVGTADKARALF